MIIKILREKNKINLHYLIIKLNNLMINLLIYLMIIKILNINLKGKIKINSFLTIKSNNFN
jgi:hypothetical protein